MHIADQADDAPREDSRFEPGKQPGAEAENDVLRGREFDFSLKFLPDGLSWVGTIGFATDPERRLLSQIQGRTYANLLAMFEHVIGRKTMEMSRGLRPGSRGTREALARIAEEEREHEALFRRLDRLIGGGMPAGYVFVGRAETFARAALARSTWSVLALICQIEVSVLAHHRANVDGDPNVSPLYRDVLLHHAREESQHAVLDSLEWARENGRLDEGGRDRAVDDLIELLGALDAVLQSQAIVDTEYFLHLASRTFDADRVLAVRDALLAAYRWQHLLTGMNEPRFAEALGAKITPEQAGRLRSALAPLLHAST